MTDNPEPTTPDGLDFLVVQYAETGKMLHVFLEWRHKVLTRYALTLGGLAVAASWLYERGASRWLKSGLFVIGVLVSVTAAVMDRVNSKIVDICYSNGRFIEEAFRPGPDIGLYGRLSSALVSPPRFRKYRTILAVVYWGGAILFVVAAAGALVIR